MMRNVMACSGLLTALFLLGGEASAQDAQKPKKDQAATDSRKATADDYKELAKKKEVTGRLLSLDGSQQLTLKVEFTTSAPKDPFAQPSPQTAQAQKQLQKESFKQQQLMQQLARAQRIRNPTIRQQKVALITAQLQTLQAQQAQQAATISNDPSNAPQKVTKTVEFQLPIVEKVKVAKAKLDPDYDDKGKLKEPTPEELKKKKSPDMPGYKATMDDVQPGEQITVYLGKSKAEEEKANKEKAKAKEKAAPADAAKNKVAAEVKDKAAAGPQDAAKGKVEVGKEKEKAKEAVASEEENRPQVRMILILSAPDPASLRDSQSNNRKKQ
jgi:hypothetical protein